MAGEKSSKLCECGCGVATSIIKKSRPERGQRIGSPAKYIRGHQPKRIKHGMYKTQAYRAWYSMIARCCSRASRSWPYYGGRGISVDPLWMDFNNFLADMGHPSPGMSLDRIDPNLGYFKLNCRYATVSEQANNRRDNVLVTAFGATKTVAQWSRETSLPWHVIRRRLARGWLPERALTSPISGRSSPGAAGGTCTARHALQDTR